ncbi:hypothetical protein V7112_11490 [Bacillus sp. JJ1566]|uniref:hypothetical protein n=1 Tax=Bacillus sp. JJ1566 TaxID=3122961 RepID=UPI002FFFE26C
MKKIIRFLIVAFVVVCLILGGRYFYTKNLYVKPHDVVGQLIEEARNDKVSSSYILEERQWDSIKAASVFEIIREPINWEEFKGFVKHCDFGLTYDHGEATYELMKERYKDNHRYVDAVCFEYDPENGQELGVKDSYSLLVENINRSWVVVGVAKKVEGAK